MIETEIFPWDQEDDATVIQRRPGGSSYDYLARET